MIRHFFMCGAAVLFVSLFFFADRADAKAYKGAEYRTKDSFLYGKFETRMKPNGREGMLASFFTYNDNYPNTPWNEIDIEVMGRYTDDVQCNTITPGQVNHVSHQFVNFNPALDYHVYGFEWTPAYVAWFIDGVEVHRQTGGHISTLNIAQKLMMNVWNPAAPNWAGTWNDAVLPAFAYYDWASYAAYTPGSGTVGTDSNFTPQWIDNFDSWDQSRWDKASHTWNGNNCDFVYANAVFQDGKLILCLTKETAIGYVDGTPPTPLWARAEQNTMRIFFSEEVDQASAEAITNYQVPNLAVASAQLLADQKTVLLSVPGLDTSSTSAVVMQGIKDRWMSPNILPLKLMSVIRQVPLSFPIRINVGGSTYQGYLADQGWNESREYGRLDGQTSYFTGVTINGTTEQEVYRSESYDLVEYKIRVPNGRYAVVLMMAENYFTNSNQRKFSVVVEGDPIETALDLYFRVGFRTAYQKAAIVDVTDGVIDIHLQGVVEVPLLNGIVVNVVTGADEQNESGVMPDGYELEQNYPNPFNGGTTIRFTLPQEDLVTLKVFDTLGRMVSERMLGEIGRGEAQVVWDATGVNGEPLPSGVYFYRLEGSRHSGIRKLVYLK